MDKEENQNKNLEVDRKEEDRDSNETKNSSKSNDLDKEDKTIDLVAKLFANKLKEDINSKNPSICCKSSPTENKKYDKKFHLATKICNKMNITHKNYRNILTKLRKQVDKSTLNTRINPISFISTYQKTNDINLEYETIFNGLINSFKENSFLNNSYLLIDSDIVNISSITQRIIILMSILYSKSELPQKLLLPNSKSSSSGRLQKKLGINPVRLLLKKLNLPVELLI